MVKYLAAIAAVAVATPAVAQSAPSSDNPLPSTAAVPGRYPFTQADVDYVDGMISHHAQAIVMAKWAPSHGADASVQTLCGRIITAQQDEIALMQQWLRQRGQAVPEPKPGPMKMKVNGVEVDMLMPGMLTDAQMAQLDSARGTAFDKLFLRDMIQHHQGAVAMVQQLFSTPGAGQDEAIFKMASDVNVDQTTEIARMQKMLFTLEIQ